MADDQYFNHYGLEKNPFSDVNDQKEFFEIPELEHRIELIKHLIEFSDRIIVLLGEEGAGKTTLLSHLVSTRDEKWHLCRLSFNDINTVDDFFKQIFIDQQLEYRELESYASKVSVLHDAFEEMQIKGYIPVLFIDDAHYLSIEILKLLFELAITKNNKPALHVVLFSETNIAQLINHRNLGFIHTLEMPLYDEDQVSMYIAHRLMTSGYQGEQVISEKQIKGIHKASNGLPGLINDLASKALQDPAIKTNSTSWFEQLYTYALNPKITLPIALVLVSVFVLYILETEVDENESKLQTKEISLPNQDTPEEYSVESKEDDIEKENPTDLQKDISQITEEPEIVLLNKEGEIIYETDNKVADKDPGETEIDEEAQVEKQVESENKTTGLKEIKPEEQVVNKENKESDKNDQFIQEILPNQLDPINKPTEKEIVSSESFEKKIISEVESEQSSLPEVKPTKPQPIEVKVSSGGNQTIRGADWLKQQSPNHYVLQLMGAYDDEAMNKFIAKNISNKQQIAKFTTVNQNKIWYVLVYGKYTNRDQAVAAIPSLPSVLRELKPWPRKIETIQRDLR